jgi:hypothetical protein
LNVRHAIRLSVVKHEDDGGGIHVDGRPVLAVAVGEQGQLAEREDARQGEDDGADVVGVGCLGPFGCIEGKAGEEPLLVEEAGAEGDVAAVGKVEVGRLVRGVGFELPDQVAAEIKAGKDVGGEPVFEEEVRGLSGQRPRRACSEEGECAGGEVGAIGDEVEGTDCGEGGDQGDG